MPPPPGAIDAFGERALVAFFLRGSAAFLVLDRQGSILHANDAFYHLMGADPEKGTWTGPECLRADLEPEAARAWLEEAFRGGRDRVEAGHWARLDGAEIPVRMAWVALESEKGPRLYVWGWDRSEEHAAHRELAEIAQVQRRMAEAIFALSLGRTPEEVHQALLSWAGNLMPGFHWFLGRIEKREGKPDVALAAWAPSLAERLGPGIPSGPVPAADTGFGQEVYRHRRACFVPEVGAAPDLVPGWFAAAGGLKSLLGVPMAFEERMAGVLFAASFQGDPPASLPEAWRDLLQGLTRIATLVLEHLQTERRMEEAARLSRTLAQGVRDLAAATDEDGLVAQMFTWAARLVPLTEWWFNRYDPASRSVTTTHWTPGVEAFGSIELIRGPDPVAGNPLLETIHIHLQAVHVPRWEDLAEREGKRHWPGPLHTWVGVPMAHEGTIVGSLSGGSFGAQGHVAISEEQFEALKSLAGTAGLALNRIQAHRDLEAQESRSRQLFERSPDATFLLARTAIIDMNQAALDLLGYPARALMGKNPLALSPEVQPTGVSSLETAAVLLAEVKEGLRNRFEWTFLHATGKEIVCDVGITQYRLGTQRIYHAVVRDLTAQKRAEAERAVLERQLFQVQKMESLGVLAGGIAHDFNNLLMGVLGHAGLALDYLPLGHPVSRNLEAIQQAGYRAADLTRQMLAYSGRGQYVVRSLDLTAHVEEMLHLLEVSLPKAVALNLDLERDLPAILGDQAQIQQVIMNLVINAAESIGEAPGTITLATDLMPVDQETVRDMVVGQDIAPGTYVCLQVSDTGCGMDADTLGRIFEPFFTTKFTGRGLGLSAIMGIVRGHHGALRVRSEVGKGTTFWALFPPSGRTPESEDRPEPPGGWRGQGTVLVVDDEPVVRSVARQALEGAGFRVLEAWNGSQAVDQVRAHGPAIDLVLLDMTMPRMGGDEAFREMRRIQPELRVVLSSGYTESEVMGSFLGQGLKGFIQKPYGPKELLARVRRILEA